MMYDKRRYFYNRNYVHPRHRLAIDLIILIFETIIKIFKYITRTTIQLFNKNKL